MTWMNEWEITDAHRKFDDHRDEVPNLHQGSKILLRLYNWTNSVSDGWAYWPLPARAAGKLMDLLHEAKNSYPLKDISEADLKKALTPIKSFLTKREVEHALILEDPKPPAKGRFESVAGPTVLGGMFIPAHDNTFDYAEAIGRMLDRFQSYVTEVRDEEQAGNATTELLKAFLAEAEKEKS